MSQAIDFLAAVESIAYKAVTFEVYGIKPIFPLLVIAGTPIAARILNKMLFQLESNSRDYRKIDITRQRMLRNITRASIYIIGIGLFMYSIPHLRSLSVGLFAGVGVMGIIIGLAAQDSLANIIAGINLAVFQPFRVGDRIRLMNEDGTIEDITLRHTVIKTWDNKRMMVPNHILSKESIINYTIEDPKILKFVDVSVSYDSDIDLARKIMLDEAKKHPQVLEDLSKDAGKNGAQKFPIVRLKEFGESGIILRLLFWSPDQGTGFQITYDLLESIKKRFDREGIEIPFPYRTIVYKKDIPKPKRLGGGKVSKTRDAKKYRKK